MFPVFRKDAKGVVSLTDTKSARVVKAEKRIWDKPVRYSDDKVAALRQCREAGGDESDAKQWMGFLRIQWGSFRGETYRWLLENSPGYFGWMVTKIKSETLSASDHLFMHKMAFLKYPCLFPEGNEIIQLKDKSKNRDNSASKKQQTTTTVVGPQLDEMDNASDDELVTCLENYEGGVKASGAAGQIETRGEPSSILGCPRATARQSPTQVPARQSAQSSASHSTIRDPTPTNTQISLPSASPSTIPDPAATNTQISVQDDNLPLTKKWKKTLPAIDQSWISKTFFRLATRGPQFDFTRVTKLWYDPPQPSLSRGVLNKQECFFGHRLFLWMPRHLLQYNFTCPHTECDGNLVNNGVHQKTRMVLDIHDYYIIVGEDYECTKCKRRVISWSKGILDQIDSTERSKFPCILTDRYACDLKVVRMMRQRTVGNSSSLVLKQIAENHGETYLDKCRQYATNFLAFKKSATRGLVTMPEFVEPPPVMDIPRHRWFMKVYQLDVISRLDYELAELTSITGRILKIDSTKKITNKLAGHSRGTAMWATNVGNEHGQILMSVLTESEGEGLRKMLDGIVSRYRNANVPPPKVLYTDRDCCGRQLDSWHFMRRFPNGCTTDKHQLYGPFMARLSRCIFQIDEEDYARLMRAKRQELIMQGVPNPSDSDVIQRITSDEVGRHCKRATRGTKETTTLITELIASLDGEKGLDSSGVPLIDSIKMYDIWSKQSVHVACLQDPEGVALYTQVSTAKKGGLELPVYKCVRGSTSLESFHLHLARFIPGTLAKDTNFQVYLLDGVFRWNADRAADAIDTRDQAATVPKTYSGPLKHQTNLLWGELCGRPFFPKYKPPTKYTGELVGVQYLYHQTGQELPGLEVTRQVLENDDDVDDENQDEGFVEMDQANIIHPEEMSLPPPFETTELPRPVLHLPTNEEYKQLAGETAVEGMEIPEGSSVPVPSTSPTTSVGNASPVEQSSPVHGPDNVPGYDKVLDLAEFLVELRNERVLRFDKVQRLTYLWEQLSDFDKKRTAFPKRFTKKPWSGKFGGRGKNVAPGVESITKVLLGPNKGPAQWPNCNRYTEATCELLLKVFPGDQKHEGTLWTRWRLVLRAFHNIRQVIVKSHQAMQQTEIQLPLLNKKTLLQWYNKEDKKEEQKVLLQGINMPKPAMTGSGLPVARQKPEVLPSSEAPSFEFHDAPCTAGLAHKRTSRKRKQPTLTPKSSEATVIRYPVIMEKQQLIVLPHQPAVFPPLTTPTTPEASTKAATTSTTYKKTRTYKTPDFVKCRKCGQNRKNSETHKSYMFKIFCQVSESISFEDWRKNIKQQMDEERKQKKK